MGTSHYIAHNRSLNLLNTLLHRTGTSFYFRFLPHCFTLMDHVVFPFFRLQPQHMTAIYLPRACAKYKNSEKNIAPGKGIDWGSNVAALNPRGPKKEEWFARAKKITEILQLD